LEDEILSLLEAGVQGAIRIAGSPGSGKTTALQHLAATLPDQSMIHFLDLPPNELAPFDAQVRLLICVTAGKGASSALPTYHLEPWGRDELIEYLLAVHKDRCASVMARISDEDQERFGGIPDVWTVILDQLAADESLRDTRTALHRYMEKQLPDTDLLERARSACLNCLTNAALNGTQPADQLGKPGFSSGLKRLLRHPPVQLLLATERAVADLQHESDCDFLALQLPLALVESIGAAVRVEKPELERLKDLLADDGLSVESMGANVRVEKRVLDHLQSLLAGPDWSHAMAASILHATRSGWMPEPGCVPVLKGAYLLTAQWPHVQLPGVNIREADFAAANLSGANLVDAQAENASFMGADLRGAVLHRFQAPRANLLHANLSAVQAEQACFKEANLTKANLAGAMLEGAVFEDADLRWANFQGANLKSTSFWEAKLNQTDFSGANLERSFLRGLRLRDAFLAGACFTGAILLDCDLEYMDLPNAQFANASLEDALLTGTVMRNADLSNTDLRGAKMAEIDWEGACLRGADLRGATFHMGSSRSGLVFSPIACQGSRTGFYTDDYDEQYFKAPEEIRKANLCRADLRGVRLTNVDFYLVDLRGALYDADQEEHFRRCGAILEARV
jgi:uncharacterized protein YjbI with pentapeptide repeats